MNDKLNTKSFLRNDEIAFARCKCCQYNQTHTTHKHCHFHARVLCCIVCVCAVCGRFSNGEHFAETIIRSKANAIRGDRNVQITFNEYILFSSAHIQYYILYYIVNNDLLDIYSKDIPCRVLLTSSTHQTAWLTHDRIGSIEFGLMRVNRVLPLIANNCELCIIIAFESFFCMRLSTIVIIIDANIVLQ